MAGPVSTTSLFPPRSAPSHRCLFLVALIGLVTVLPVAVAAADSLPPRQAVVLIIIQSTTKVDNEALSSLISDSMRLELEARGVKALPVDDHAANDKAVVVLAAEKKADFALWGTYTQTGTSIKLSARWLDAEGVNEPGQGSRTGPLDLSFDELVTGLVDEIVDSQQKNIAKLPPAPVTQPVPDPVPQPAVVAVPPDPPLPRFAFSLSGSPFIATFAALSYFPVGYSFTLDGHYQMKAPGGVFGAGIASGLSTFHGKGTYAQADFYVVPIGADVRFGTRTGSALDFYAHLAGGPAIFVAKLATGEALTKVIPYASGGVGMVWRLIDVLALSLEAGYTCYFDSPDPIAGFAPSLAVVLRL
jgi:hypothetical protein